MTASATLLTSGTYTSATLTSTFVTNTFNTGTGERLIVLLLACDNYGTSPSNGVGSVQPPTSSPVLTWTAPITSGMVATPSTDYLNGAVTYRSASPAVGSGTTVGLWYTYLSAATAAQDVTVTFNFSPNTRTKAYQVFRVDASAFTGAPAKINVSPFFGLAGATTATPSITSGTLQPGKLWFGVSGTETNASPTVYDSDTTNGTWVGFNSTVFQTTANSGSVTTSQRLYVDYKVHLNSQSTQTFNFTQTSADSQLIGFAVEVFEPADAPTGVTAIDNQNQQATLSWTAPSNWGGQVITDYAVQYRTPAGTGSWTTWSHAASTSTSATITGLTNGQSYEFQVAAVTTANAVTKTGAWSSSAYAQPTLHELTGGNAIKVRDGWGLNTGNLDPTTIIPWSQFWSVESPLFRSYINAETVTDGVALVTSGVTFMPQIGTATAGQQSGIYRKGRSELGYSDAIGPARLAYTSLSSPYSTNAVLEIWWVANMVDVVLPTSGTTSSLWFGWPTVGFGSQSLYDHRTTTGAYWAFTDKTTNTPSTTGATAWTDASTHLYRVVLTSDSNTAQLYRDNVLFTQQTSANLYYTANASSSLNLGYALSGSLTMRSSGTNTPIPNGPGPLVPFWGTYSAGSTTTATQQAKMLQWARAKYGVA